MYTSSNLLTLDSDKLQAHNNTASVYSLCKDSDVILLIVIYGLPNNQ